MARDTENVNDVRRRGTPHRWDHHVAIVTGGNSGIGLGMALGLAQAGASVAIWGRDPDKNASAVNKIRALGVDAHTCQCDVSNETQVENAMLDTLDAFGRVDSLTACAGISGYAPSIADTSLEEWRRVLSVNLDGTFLTLRAAAKHMIGRNGPGALVVVSSTAAIHGAGNSPHYGASKTALVGLVRSLAVQLARHQIRVNALLPGWTDTELLAQSKQTQKFVEATIRRTPVRRWADPDEYGPTAKFLADPELSFHTGDTITMDGGYTIF